MTPSPHSLSPIPESHISRRTVAKGAAWAVPAVTIATVTPALASSSQPIRAHVCGLSFPRGGDPDIQSTKIRMGITSLTGQPIKAGTTLTWTLTCDRSDLGGAGWFSAPNVSNTSEDWIVTRQTHTGEWYMSQTGFVRFTWTAVRDVLPGNFECTDNAPLVNINRLPSRTQITISVNDVENGTANVIVGSEGTLVFRAPRRFSGSYVGYYYNRALRFIEKTGTVACFPPVTYTYNITSNDPTCAEQDSNDSSTIYPDGTCVHEEWTSGDITLPSRC